MHNKILLLGVSSVNPFKTMIRKTRRRLRTRRIHRYHQQNAPPLQPYVPDPNMPTGQFEGPEFPSSFQPYGSSPPKDGVKVETACSEFCTCATCFRIFIHLIILAGIICIVLGRLFLIGFAITRFPATLFSSLTPFA